MAYVEYIQKATIGGLEMFAIPHPTVIVCDHPGCKNQFPEGIGIRSDDTRLALEARAAGWVGPMERGKEGDLCPEHAKPPAMSSAPHPEQ